MRPAPAPLLILTVKSTKNKPIRILYSIHAIQTNDPIFDPKIGKGGGAPMSHQSPCQISKVEDSINKRTTIQYATNAAHIRLTRIKIPKSEKEGSATWTCRSTHSRFDYVALVHIQARFFSKYGSSRLIREFGSMNVNQKFVT